MNTSFRTCNTNKNRFTSILFSYMVALLLCDFAFAGNVSVAWDASLSSNVGGYTIFYGTATKNYTNEVDAGKVTSYNLTGLTEGETYYIAVKAYNTNGTKESVYSNEITATVPVTTQPLTANFSANRTTGVAPLVVSFTPNTTGTVTGWSWNFGDSAIPVSKAQNPTVTYSTPGTYTVSLTVTGPSGSTTSNKAGYITVTENAPTANFTTNVVSGLAPLTVAFSDTSTGTISSRTWDFGDGTSSTAANPSHVYTVAGSFSVSLTVSGPGGTNTKTAAALVKVSQPVPNTSNDYNTAKIVAAYGFEETDRIIAADASGYGNHGYIRGATRVSEGRYGRGLKFDGIDDWVSISSSNSLGIQDAFSLEAWVKPLDAGQQSVIAKEQSGGSVYNLYAFDSDGLPASSIMLAENQAVRTLPGVSPLPTNEWSHLVATYDGKVQKLYVNGVEVSSRAQTGLIKSSQGVLRIGGNKLFGDFFNGYIDEVRVYNRALPATDVIENMGYSIRSTKVRHLLLGNNAIETDVVVQAQGIAQAYKATASKSGVGTAVRVFLGAGSTASEIAVGIYDDVAGHPGTLLAKASSTKLVTDDLNQVEIPTVRFEANKSYWIAVLGVNGTIATRFGAASGVPVETSSSTTLKNMPNTWVTGDAYLDGAMSGYAVGYIGL